MKQKKNYPIEEVYVAPWKDNTIKYTCPDCNIPMIRFNRIHSPTDGCFHSRCEKCGLEYCDFYRVYWGNKPKNKDVIRHVK